MRGRPSVRGEVAVLSRCGQRSRQAPWLVTPSLATPNGAQTWELLNRGPCPSRKPLLAMRRHLGVQADPVTQVRAETFTTEGGTTWEIMIFTAVR